MTTPDEFIHITVPGSPEDPRGSAAPAGVIVHHAPELHPDDVTVIDGIRVTSVARTLVDLAEDMSKEELRATFHRAQDRGLLDLDAVEASLGRVEWRPSLATVREVVDEFCR